MFKNPFKIYIKSNQINSNEMKVNVKYAAYHRFFVKSTTFSFLLILHLYFMVSLILS